MAMKKEKDSTYSGIREATDTDWVSIWPIFQAITAAGDTYAYQQSISFDEGRQLWMEIPRKTYVVEAKDGSILGTYYIKTNHAGPGSHVCNCGYMVAPNARGQGLATRMCEHSQMVAVNKFRYKAMQYNFVAASNAGAVRLWKKLGFDEVGRLPQAFRHPIQGYVDALVMYKWLGDPSTLENTSV